MWFFFINFAVSLVRNVIVQVDAMPLQAMTTLLFIEVKVYNTWCFMFKKKISLFLSFVLVCSVVFSGCSNEDFGYKIPKGLKAIDLGLPSGTKWANMNLGTNKTEGLGSYFAWGEVETKSSYSWETYMHCDGNKENCFNFGESISGTGFDVAKTIWGGKWQMPTKEQADELLGYCTATWTTSKGVDGMKFKGKNGKTIFLPVTGYRVANDTITKSQGYYVTGSQNPDSIHLAYELHFHRRKTETDGKANRGHGFIIRPVMK